VLIQMGAIRPFQLEERRCWKNTFGGILPEEFWLGAL
jgi:hypothetical protein